MQNTFYMLLTFISLFFLNGCGEDTEISFDKASKNLSLTPVNDNAPVLTSDNNISVAENQTSALTLTATDTDTVGNLTYSISGGDSTNFTLNAASGLLVFKVAPDFESKSSYTFNATVSDGTLSSTEAVTINVTDVNDNTPTFTSDLNVSVAENQTSALTLTSTDTDTVGNLTYSITGEEFSVNETTGVVTFKIAPDFESKSSYTFFATVSDGVFTATQTIAVNILDIQEEPLLSDFSTSIDENTNDTLVGSLTINEGTSSITNMTLEGVGSSDFSVALDGTISIASGVTLDYERQTSYALSIYATNASGNSFPKSINIAINNFKNPFQIAKSIASNPMQGAYYGYDVAVDGNYTVVSAPWQVVNGTLDVGQVYVYKKDSDGLLQEIATLTSTAQLSLARFGVSVDIDNSYIAVSVNKDTDSANAEGEVYFYKIDKNDKVSLLTTLTSPNKTSNAYFGNALKIQDNVLLVGARGEDKAYIYELNTTTDTLTHKTTITTPSSDTATDFGYALDMHENNIVIGAFKEDISSNTDAGAAYYYELQNDFNVSSAVQLLPSQHSSGDWFGKSVAVYNDKIIVGAVNADSFQGNVYLYTINSDTNVTQTQQLQATDRKNNDQFGASVALNSSSIIVGADRDDDGAENIGSIYIFDLVDGIATQSKEIHAYDISDTTHFGYSLDLNKERFIVGAYTRSNAFTSDGSAYLFDLEAEDKIYVYSQETTISIDEGNASVFYTLEASSLSGVSSSSVLAIDDGSNFTLTNEQNLSFTTAPNFELPSDKDTNNIYSLTLSLSDGVTTKELPISVTVEDKFYYTSDKVYANIQEASAEFGNAVAVSGNYFVVGSEFADYADTANGTNSGVAYLYKTDINGTATYIKTLIGDDTKAGDNFGCSVAIDGAYIVIGAIGEDTGNTNTGSAYLYKIVADDNIVQIAKIHSASSDASDFFGTSVAIDGDYILIGAKSAERDSGTFVADEGLAYVFKRNSDSEVVELAELSISNNDTSPGHFGSAVSINGNHFYVGAPDSDNGSSAEGSVIVFNRVADNDFQEYAILNSNSPVADENFGSSVSSDGEYLVVGAPGRNTVTGAAYVFKDNTVNNYDYKATLTASDASQYSYFGSGVSISGDFISIAAYRRKFDDTTTRVGAVYIYKNYGSDIFAQEGVFVPDPENDADSFYGAGVSFDGEALVVGAFGDNSRTGAAYFYRLDVE